MAKSTKDKQAREGDNGFKGQGWKGPLKIKGGKMTEYSVGVQDSTGKDRLIPSIVSSSTKADIKVIRKSAERGVLPPDSLIDKAVRHADSLASKGKGPWAPAGYTPPKKKGK